MCGRYQFDFSDRDRFRARYDIEGNYPYSEIKTRYNVAPGQSMPVVVSRSPNSVELMLWGLIPGWDRSDKPKGFINLRDDTVASKAWAQRYLASSRCLVPASGFYEWRKADGEKIPYYIRPETGDYFSFAGLWSEWRSPATGQTEKTYTIITTSPNGFMEPIHNRMPAILTREEEEEWLNPDNAEIARLKELLHPYRGPMKGYPVSRRVNSPAHDDAQVIEPEAREKLF